jgi:TusA-related sulfurtransferase
MSATLTLSDYAVSISPELSEPQQQLLTHFLPQIPVTVSEACDAMAIVAVVDGRGMACPLPLLKTKVALRSVNSGEALYVIATDPNSTADIAAFCRQSGAKTLSNTVSAQLDLRLQYQSDGESTRAVRPNDTLSETTVANNAAQKGSADTFFHFIITKTDSNSA